MPSSTTSFPVMSEALAFVLDAPLQSWGNSSRFQRRETGSWPTKSGVIGLLAAALGIDKYAADEAERLAPLAALRFHCYRWDKRSPIQRLNDFHTVGGGYEKNDPWQKLCIPRKAGDGSPFGTVITQRSYLADARFLIVLEGDDHVLLEQCVNALLDPVWGVWLGRKSCIPARPFHPTLATTALGALSALALLLGEPEDAFALLEGQREEEGAGAFRLKDQPVSFGAHHGIVPSSYPTRSVRHVRGVEQESKPE